MEKIVFKQDMCNAEVSGNTGRIFELCCFKGKIRVEGDIIAQFRVYRSWCEGCNKKHIVDKQELQKMVKAVAHSALIIEAVRGEEEATKKDNKPDEGLSAKDMFLTPAFLALLRSPKYGGMEAEHSCQDCDNYIDVDGHEGCPLKKCSFEPINHGEEETKNEFYR